MITVRVRGDTALTMKQARNPGEFVSRVNDTVKGPANVKDVARTTFQ